MKNQECNPDKQIRFLAIIMTIVGIFLWLSSSFDREIIQGIGLFLFLLGAININKNKKEKKNKLTIIIIGFLLLIAGILFYFLNK